MISAAHCALADQQFEQLWNDFSLFHPQNGTLFASVFLGNIPNQMVFFLKRGWGGGGDTRILGFPCQITFTWKLLLEIDSSPRKIRCFSQILFNLQVLKLEERMPSA